MKVLLVKVKVILVLNRTPAYHDTTHDDTHTLWLQLPNNKCNILFSRTVCIYTFIFCYFNVIMFTILLILVYFCYLIIFTILLYGYLIHEFKQGCIYASLLKRKVCPNFTEQCPNSNNKGIFIFISLSMPYVRTRVTVIKVIRGFFYIWKKPVESNIRLMPCWGCQYLHGA